MQGQEGAILDAGQRALACRCRFDQREVLGLGGSVDDQEEPFSGRTGDHQVVADTALVIQQQGVFLFASRERGEICRDQRFQRSLVTDITRLAHMGDVEQSCPGPTVIVFTHNAERVLDRHVIAGKRHHLAAEFDVQGVQRCLEKGVGHQSGPCATEIHKRLRLQPLPPLSR